MAKFERTVVLRDVSDPAQRAALARELDKMHADGLLEGEVEVRVRGAPTKRRVLGSVQPSAIGAANAEDVAPR